MTKSYMTDERFCFIQFKIKNEKKTQNIAIFNGLTSVISFGDMNMFFISISDFQFNYRANYRPCYQ